jgi:hypothetical protein
MDTEQFARELDHLLIGARLAGGMGCAALALLAVAAVVCAVLALIG